MRSKALFYRVFSLLLAFTLILSTPANVLAETEPIIPAEDAPVIPEGYLWRTIPVSPVPLEDPDDASEAEVLSRQEALESEAAVFWELLLSRESEAAWDENPRTPELTLTGWMPEGVSAQAELVSYAEVDRYSELALLHAVVRLSDEEGLPWTPDLPLTLSVSGPTLQDALEGDFEPTAYVYHEEADSSGEPCYTVQAYGLAASDDKSDSFTLDREGARVEGVTRALLEDPEAPDALCLEIQEDTVRLAVTVRQPERSLIADAEAQDTRLSVVGRLPASCALSVEAGDAEPFLDAVPGEVLAAWDAALLWGEEAEWKPDAPIQLCFRDPVLAQEAEDVVLSLWTLDETGTPRQVRGAVFSGTTARASVDSLSSFAVSRNYREKRLSADAGEGRSVRLTYDRTAGLPEQVALTVREIGPEEGYDRYLAQALTQLGCQDETVSFAAVLDVTLTDPATGETCQPETPVLMSLDLPGLTSGQSESVRVVHFHGETGDAPQVLEAAAEGSSVAFRTDGFSVYAVIGVEPVLRRTYQFFIWNATDQVYAPYEFTTDSGVITFEQTVRDGELPVIPQPTVNDEDQLFAGWFERIDTAGDEPILAPEPYDFHTPVTQDEVIELYAVFTNYLYLVFYDQYSQEIADFPIACTRRGAPNGEGKAAVRISDVTLTYSGGSDMAFYGWSYTPVSQPGAALDDNGDVVSVIQPDAEGCIEIDKDTQLYPIYKPVKWLSFWSGPTGSGATYYPAQRYFDGVGPGSLADHVPERAGFTFLGWYAGSVDSVTGAINYGASPITNPDGTLINGAADGGMSVYGGALHLTDDATLYALWEGEAAANYKVIVWKQKATASTDTPKPYKYDFVLSVVRSAPIGGTAFVEEALRGFADPGSESYDPAYAGYTCRWDADVTPVSDKGYTVLHVYYDREGAAPQEPTAHPLTFRDSADGTEIASYPSVLGQTNLLTGNEGGSFVPAQPARDHYTFTGWYADPICSTQVFFTQAALDAYTGYDQTVLYSQMPDAPLTVYAGWEADWYIVQIDPNYGSFNGTGSTWTWKTVESDLIQEYTQVTRDYVESSSGQYYYVKHDRAYYGYSGNEWDNSEPDRDARYTRLPGEATEYKTFELAPGVYSYAGWYEVLADGTEIPYDFGAHVDHDTLIRLRWKKAGDYYVRYLAGEGIMDDGGKESADERIYADTAQFILTRGAVAPAGLVFVGWRVQGDPSETVYRVGEPFTLQADYAVSVSGRDTVTLEAVYTQPGTARIIYDFNGGVADGDFDFGHPRDSHAEFDTELAQDGGSATVSQLVNNSDFYLSSGAGLTRTDAVLKGWSNKPVYSELDPEAILYALGPGPSGTPDNRQGLYGVDSQEPVTLYAVWEVRVTWHLNVPAQQPAELFQWGGDWTESGYALELTPAGETVYTRTLYAGNPISEPSSIPQYAGEDGLMFFAWTEAADSKIPYDFARPVTGALELYAFWREPIQVPVHALDASAHTIVEIDPTQAGWTVNSILAGVDEVPLPGTGSYVTVPAGSHYELAFVAAHDRNAGFQSISRAEQITGIYYDQQAKHLYVEYADPALADAPLDEGSDIYFVFYQKRALDISYRTMPPSGELVPAAGLSSGVPAQTDVRLGEYEMGDQVTQPLGWMNSSSVQYFAYAIGDAEAGNASGLRLITSASNADSARPCLRLRNTWRGFQYATEEGDEALWVDCGYDPTLYVVYFDQLPTVVMFHEQTVGVSAVLDRAFTFHLLVTQTHTQVQKQRRDGENWVNVGEVFDWTSEVFDTDVAPNVPYLLKNGEANSAILFYSVPSAGQALGTEFLEDGAVCRYIATAGTVVFQTAVVTQDRESDFDTFFSGTLFAEEPYRAVFSSDGDGGTLDVTFTNKHRSASIEVHVARIENGSILLRDELRPNAESCSFPLPIDSVASFLDPDLLPAEAVYADADGAFAFGGIVSGFDDGTQVTVGTMGLGRIRYGKNRTDSYTIQLQDDGGNDLGDLGEQKIYYLYYPMPVIQYVKREGNSLSLIRGSRDGINLSADLTYSGEQFQMNGETVVQDQRLSLPFSGLEISQATGASTFKMPPVLDDETYQRYLSYSGVSVGPRLTSGETGSLAGLEVSMGDGCGMYLRISNNDLEWSFDGSVWHEMTEEQTIYAIYTEHGYDLQLTKVVDTDASGSNPILTDRSFTLSIRSEDGRLLEGAKYRVVGTDATEVAVQADGTIRFQVRDGSRIKVQGLPRGQYTIIESNNENYDLSAKYGPLVGTATQDAAVTDSGVQVTLQTDTQLILVNSPKAICKITDAHLFYTMRDAVDFVVNQYADATATIELLTDYLMPAADVVTIPANAHITITTATEGTYTYPTLGSRAVISRSQALADSALITNSGELTLINITLDGRNVAASQPLIESGGSLILDRGTTLQNARNSGDGGAISATGFVALVDGSDVYLKDNQAANGGLLYYTGTGSVSLAGGVISGNTATNSGGVLYAAGGSITVYGGTFSGNRAAGNGGAVCGENAQIQIQGGSFSGNQAEHGSGGAVYSGSGPVTVSGGSLNGNNAAISGGAIYAVGGAVTLSGGVVSGNTAADHGGAVYAGTGTVSVSGASVRSNTASNGSGGAIYARSGPVSVSGELSGNTAALDGGAIFAVSGGVTVSAGADLRDNASTRGNGGAVWSDTGAVFVTGGSLTKNRALQGFGGAVYANAAVLTITDGLLGGSEGANRAKNGAAVYVNTGNGSFSGGTITGNLASQGGAVGVGADSARLDFTGTVVIRDNTATGVTGYVNVYLDQDTEAVINTVGFDSGAYVGIYVPDRNDEQGSEYLFKNRGDVGAQFGTFGGGTVTEPAFFNDREQNLKAVVNDITRRIYWSSPIKVRVRYLASYSALPTGSNGDSKFSSGSYYPSVGNTAISVLADELREKCTNLSATAVYATAMIQGDTNYDHYLTHLLWEDGKWRVEKRDGTKADLNTGKEIVIYYSEPTLLSIENNTAFDLDLSSLLITLAGADRSLLNSADVTGFGLVFARDGAIQEELLPVQTDENGKLLLDANGGSVSILIPGGRNCTWKLNGAFVNGSGTVKLRFNGNLQPEVDAASPVALSAKTLDSSGTYEIVFGEDKYICKIVHDGRENRFTTLNGAFNYAKTQGLTDVIVEMLVDYLMPSTDIVALKDSQYHFSSITLTTAKSGEYHYSGDRATISRGNGITAPLIDIQGNVGATGTATETFFTVRELNFDGKNLSGECEGGAIKTQDCKVHFENAGFSNCVSFNGGAIFISYGTPNNVSAGSTKQYTFAKGYHGENAVLTLKNCTFTNCEAKYRFQRSGGGAIWSNAKLFAAQDCEFTSCLSTGSNMQGGAVFHRIEATTKLKQTPYFAESQTIFHDCIFTRCKAEAGGGLESDACDIQLHNCTFTSCSTTRKDGGAFNVYIFETNFDYTMVESRVLVNGCSFIGCTSSRNGGAIRSLATMTEVRDSTFLNTTANLGGSIYVSNRTSDYLRIDNCSFTGITSNSGGGGAIYTVSRELSVSGGTTFTNCKAKGSSGSGGAIYHYVYSTAYLGRVNATGSFTSLSDTTFTGCTANQHGGGLYTNALNEDESHKFLVRCTFKNCASETQTGGGVSTQSSSAIYATVEGSTFEGCTAAKGGGGLYCTMQRLTVGDSADEAGNPIHSTFKGCTSKAIGGGINHSNDKAGGYAVLTNCTVDGCTAVEFGGGVYTNAQSGALTGCHIQNNTVTGSECRGGGIYYNSVATQLTIKNSYITGNKSNGYGGGLYCRSALALEKTYVMHNELLHNTAENAAGVFVGNGRNLYIGSPDLERDNTAVVNNTTLNGADSNLRLSENTSYADLRNSNSVRVLCNLGQINGEGGYIGVVNAKYVGTQFGQSDFADPHIIQDPDGTTEGDAVFQSDRDTLYGIISRTDTTRTKIIWAGPPVCKITDEDGKLLYFKSNGSDPAIFDVLEDGSASGRTSAFSLLRSAPTLYYAPQAEGTAGKQYKGNVFVVKMLVEEYELTNQITTVNSADKTIILTTAGKQDTDSFPFDANAAGDRAAIYRGPNVKGSMVSASVHMQFRNILLDGMNTVSNQDGAIVSIKTNNSVTVKLQTNAVFQNGSAANGGAVAVTVGSFTLEGGLIRFCAASKNGGAVYAGNADPEKGFQFNSGNIQQCQAVNGGGVYLQDGALKMTGGSISGCAASALGGGVCVAAGKTFHMSGGRIGTDGANQAGTAGGGIAAGENAVLNFTRQVNVSRNTRGGSSCNLQLDQDSNFVIHTEGLFSRSYIGVYVPDAPAGTETLYEKHGVEGAPFAQYLGSSANLYCFVNDRNGLKGGLIAETDPNFVENTVYWIKIFSIEVSKTLEVSDQLPEAVRQAAQQQEFTFTVRLWDTDKNVSSIKVADIAADIQAAIAAGEDSKYGDIRFTADPRTPGIITAQVTMKSGETYTAENLPDGLGYDVTEHQLTGYANLPDAATMPINFRSGETGENKGKTDVNPYVSQVQFRNILPVCKITDASGKLLYRNPVSSGVANGEQTPAVYKDLAEAFAVINGGTLYPQGSNISFSDDFRVEMLVPEYSLPEGLTLTSRHALTLTTAAGNASDGFPYTGTEAAVVKRSGGFTAGSMLTLSGHGRLTLTNLKLDGNKDVTAEATGGLVYVPAGGQLTVTSGSILQNSRTTGDGAGVYVAEGGTLFLSGDPVFGTTDTDAYAYLYNKVGNFKVGSLSGLENGGKTYTVAHQDIYLAESHENAPASLVINGALEGANGSIWVWAESAYHHKQLAPFAVLGNGVSGGNLHIFRNALDDETTENRTDSYLYGTAREDASETGRFVCWNGVEGMARVILTKVRKSENSYFALSEKTFTVYTNSEMTKVAKGSVRNSDGTVNDSFLLQDLRSGEGGTFFIGELPYGRYFVSEDSVNGQHFEFTVDAGGVVSVSGTGEGQTLTPVKLLDLLDD